ncbi:4-nitrophenylphosphatase [Aphelenchoides avenae]|nr:4-nitrophenylphosphatase [Aphelenchus avenae]
MAAWLTRALRSSVVPHYDTFIFDADGVLWHDDSVIPGATELVADLTGAGKRVIIVTNNSTKTLEEYAQKTRKLGFTNLTAENVVSAGIVTAHELKKTRNGEQLPVYLVGSVGMQKMLADVGIESFGPGPDNVDDTANAGRYVKIMKAVNYLKDPSVKFIATNEDLTYPGSVPGVICPGAGTVSAPIKAVSGREPTVMGKPHTATFEYIRAKYNIDPARSLMIGDRCDTDILFGNRHGIDTLLVLTGVHNLADVELFRAEGKAELIPKYWAPSVQSLVADEN